MLFPVLLLSFSSKNTCIKLDGDWLGWELGISRLGMYSSPQAVLLQLLDLLSSSPCADAFPSALFINPVT